MTFRSTVSEPLDTSALARLFERLALAHLDLGWQAERDQARELAQACRLAHLFGADFALSELELGTAAEHERRRGEHEAAISTLLRGGALQRRHDEAHAEAAYLHGEIAEALREAARLADERESA